MTEWSEAACLDKDPGIFFPERGEDVGPARAICNECPIQLECLDYALTEKIMHGIWGGASERQRRRMRSLISLPDRGRPGEPYSRFQRSHHSTEPPHVG